MSNYLTKYQKKGEKPVKQTFEEWCADNGTICTDDPTTAESLYAQYEKDFEINSLEVQFSTGVDSIGPQAEEAQFNAGPQLNQQNFRFVSPDAGSWQSGFGETNIFDVLKPAVEMIASFGDGSNRRDPNKIFNPTGKDLYAHPELQKRYPNKPWKWLITEDEAIEYNTQKYLDQRAEMHPDKYREVKDFSLEDWRNDGYSSVNYRGDGDPFTKDVMLQGDRLENWEHPDADTLRWNTQDGQLTDPTHWGEYDAEGNLIEHEIYDGPISLDSIPATPIEMDTDMDIIRRPSVLEEIEDDIIENPDLDLGDKKADPTGENTPYLYGGGLSRYEGGGDLELPEVDVADAFEDVELPEIDPPSFDVPTEAESNLFDGFNMDPDNDDLNIGVDATPFGDSGPDFNEPHTDMDEIVLTPDDEVDISDDEFEFDEEDELDLDDVDEESPCPCDPRLHTDDDDCCAPDPPPTEEDDQYEEEDEYEETDDYEDEEIDDYEDSEPSEGSYDDGDDERKAIKKANKKSLGERVINTWEKVGTGLVNIAKPLNRLLHEKQERKRRRQMQNAYLADNMYTATDADLSGSKGDHDVNTGIFRPDDKVVSRQGRYGMELPIAQSMGEFDYNFINAGSCKGGGCAGNPYLDQGASAFVGVEGSDLDDALLQGGLKSHVGYTGGSGLGLNLSGEVGGQSRLQNALEGDINPELFYKGKLGAGYVGDPITLGDDPYAPEYTGFNLGGYGEYDSNYGTSVGVEGGWGPVSLRGGYNLDTKSPFVGAGINLKFQGGGGLKSQITDYDEWRELEGRYDDPDDYYNYTDQEWNELMYPTDDVYWHDDFTNEDRFGTNKIFGEDVWAKGDDPNPPAKPISDYYNQYTPSEGSFDKGIDYYDYDPLTGNPEWTESQRDNAGNWGRSENYSNWAGNRRHYKPGNDYKGYYSDQTYGFENPLTFNEQQLDDIFNTHYSVRQIDRRGKFNRKEDRYVNRHRDDYLKLKGIFEESAGHELHPMQVHDIYRAMNYQAQREGSMIDPSMPTRSRYMMDDYVYGEADEFMNPAPVEEEFVEEDFQYDDTNELDIEAYPEEEESIEVYKEPAEVVQKESAPSGYIPQSQRNAQPVVEESIVETNKNITEPTSEEEPALDRWELKKRKREAMFAKYGGYFAAGGEAEIDVNMYKQLIAAGADIEII
tara:strand:- start:2374 stop:5892 length:3519 start_codon:yes stop_codon:yes gene_type:complete